MVYTYIVDVDLQWVQEKKLQTKYILQICYNSYHSHNTRGEILHVPMIMRMQTWCNKKTNPNYECLSFVYFTLHSISNQWDVSFTWFSYIYIKENQDLISNHVKRSKKCAQVHCPLGFNNMDVHRAWYWFQLYKSKKAHGGFKDNFKMCCA